MTKVERLYEEEKQQAVKQAVKKAVEENTVIIEANTSRRIAINMLRQGVAEEQVSSYTGLSLQTVRKLALEAV